MIKVAVIELKDGSFIVREFTESENPLKEDRTREYGRFTDLQDILGELREIFKDEEFSIKFFKEI